MQHGIFDEEDILSNNLVDELFYSNPDIRDIIKDVTGFNEENRQIIYNKYFHEYSSDNRYALSLFVLDKMQQEEFRLPTEPDHLIEKMYNRIKLSTLGFEISEPDNNTVRWEINNSSYSLTENLHIEKDEFSHEMQEKILDVYYKKALEHNYFKDAYNIAKSSNKPLEQIVRDVTESININASLEDYFIKGVMENLSNDDTERTRFMFLSYLNLIFRYQNGEDSSEDESLLVNKLSKENKFVAVENLMTNGILHMPLEKQDEYIEKLLKVIPDYKPLAETKEGKLAFELYLHLRKVMEIGENIDNPKHLKNKYYISTKKTPVIHKKLKFNLAGLYKRISEATKELRININIPNKYLPFFYSFSELIYREDPFCVSIEDEYNFLEAFFNVTTKKLYQKMTTLVYADEDYMEEVYQKMTTLGYAGEDYIEEAIDVSVIGRTLAYIINNYKFKTTPSIKFGKETKSLLQNLEKGSKIKLIGDINETIGKDVKGIEIMVEGNVGDNFLEHASKVKAYIEGDVGNNLGVSSKYCDIQIDGLCGIISEDAVSDDLVVNGEKIIYGHRTRALMYLGTFLLPMGVVSPVVWPVIAVPYALAWATHRKSKNNIIAHNDAVKRLREVNGILKSNIIEKPNKKVVKKPLKRG